MTELCDVVTREPKEVKIGDIEEPNERRESCPIINGVSVETEEVKDEDSVVHKSSKSWQQKTSRSW
jgi:hypothetical protein